ncbi:hypothetical protein AXF42_Ash014457 [Apostasia shenzhenica]|uniref:Cystatin domain-containing protein n=1 Tax=Apostasia shenzhenica TaxID=1088818 RepID=A0A2H9ZWJ8_9ASPA|nr:hypothetical protein AXF42_Ash014457 [Apostasia shenzhenica]
MVSKATLVIIFLVAGAGSTRMAVEGQTSEFFRPGKVDQLAEDLARAAVFDYNHPNFRLRKPAVSLCRVDFVARKNVDPSIFVLGIVVHVRGSKTLMAAVAIESLKGLDYNPILMNFDPIPTSETTPNGPCNY